MIKLKQDSFLLKTEKYSPEENIIDLNKYSIYNYINVREYSTVSIEKIQ